MTARSHGIPPVKGGQGRTDECIERVADAMELAAWMLAIGIAAGVFIGVALGWAVWA